MNPVDDLADDIRRSLDEVDVSRRPLFFAACAERLFPFVVDHYAAERRDSHQRIRAILDDIWSVGADDQRVRRDLQEMEGLTAEIQTRSTPLALMAERACICVDAALRWRLRDEEASTDWTEYPIDAIASAVSLALTGHSDLGSGTAGDLLIAKVAGDSRMVDEIRMEHEDIEALRHQLVQPSEIRKRAQANSWCIAHFAPWP